MRMVVLAAIGLCGLATSVAASERTGYAAIATGDLAAAERTLLAERRIFPDRPELMLNLAAVYAKTGRVDAARALYEDVRTRRPTALRTGGGITVSSHDVAALGLSRLTPEMAAR